MADTRSFYEKKLYFIKIIFYWQKILINMATLIYMQILHFSINFNEMYR